MLGVMVSGNFRQDLAGDDRVNDESRPRRIIERRQEILGNQRTNLVTGEEPPGASSLHGDCQAICIGVIGEREIHPSCGCCREELVEHTRFFWVREWCRGEVAIGLLLVSNGNRIGKSGRGE